MSSEISIVEIAEEGSSLTSFVKKHFFPSRSLRSVKSLIEKNCCKVNGVMERFGSKKVQAGDVVECLLAKKFSSSTFTTLYEDKNLLIVHKPAGVESIQENLPFEEGRLVHRLDKETSGVLVLSKNKETKSSLMQAFASRKVKKKYLAIVHGQVKKKKGLIQMKYGKLKNYQGGSLWGEVENGVDSSTSYRVLALSTEHTLLEVSPHTGKTHQIRSHLASIGHPIIGDYQYDRQKRKKFFPRVMLHSVSVRVSLSIVAKAPIPKEFAEALSQCQLAYEDESSY